MNSHGTRLATVALLGGFASFVWGQGPAGSLLVIETTNRIPYARDLADYSLLATKPGSTSAAPDRNFGQVVLIGDIVAIKLVNGKPAEVLYAGGYPGAVDRYQVNFRVPDSVASGLISVRLSSAWIQGPEAKLPVE